MAPSGAAVPWRNLDNEHVGTVSPVGVPAAGRRVARRELISATRRRADKENERCVTPDRAARQREGLKHFSSMVPHQGKNMRTAHRIDAHQHVIPPFWLLLRKNDPRAGGRVAVH